MVLRPRFILTLVIKLVLSDIIYKLDHSHPTVLFHTPKPCPSVVYVWYLARVRPLNGRVIAILPALREW